MNRNMHGHCVTVVIRENFEEMFLHYYIHSDVRDSQSLANIAVFYDETLLTLTIRLTTYSVLLLVMKGLK